MMNFIKRTLLLSLLSFVILFYFIFFTGLGFRLSIKFAHTIWPHFSYTQLSGSFKHGQIRNLWINDSNFTFKSKQIDISLNPFYLFFNLIAVKHITLEQAQLLITQKNSKQQFKWHFPTTIRIDSAHIKNLFLRFNEQNVDFSEVNFSGSVNEDGFNLKQLKITNQNSSVEAKLRIYFKPTINWMIKVFSQELNLQDFFQPLYSHIQLSLSTKGSLSDKGSMIDFKIEKLKGELERQAIDSFFEFHLNHQNIDFLPSYLNWGDAKLNLSGTIKDQWNLKWNLNIPSIKHLFPSYTGKIISHGIILGNWQKPNLNLSSFLENISIDSIFIKSGLLEAHIDSDLNKISNVNAELNHLNWRNKNIDRINLKSSGQLVHHLISGSIKSHEIINTFQIKGAYAAKNWQGEIQKFDVQTEHHLWQMQKSSHLVFSPMKILLAPLCIQNQNQSFCHRFLWEKNKGWLINTTLKNLALATLFNKKIELFNASDRSISVQGQLNAEATFQSDALGKKTGQLQAQLSPTDILFDFNDQEQLQHLDGAEINANLNQTGFTASGAIHFPKNHSLTLKFLMPNYQADGFPDKRQAIHGEAHLNLTDLNFFSLLIHHLQNPKGNLQLDANISGTFYHPIIQGNAAIKNGTANIPSLNLELKNIDLHAASRGKEIVYSGNVTSGQQRLGISGQTQLFLPGLPSVIHARGKSILICNTPHYQIYADPNIELHFSHHDLEITGSVFIPKAKIVSDELRAETLEASSDIVFLNQKENKALRRELDITTNLNIQLGNDVAINVRGVQGHLEGHLKLHFDPQTITTGFGQLAIVDGVYTFYGTNLTINRGKIIYTGGPLENPGIDVQASRKVAAATLGTANFGGGIISGMFSPPGEIIVGVNLLGTIHDYEVQLFSEPSIYNQSDILSLLIFGSVTDSVAESASNQGMLLQAISSLNLAGSQISNVTQQLQKAFGFEKFGVEQQAQFVPGKQAFEQSTAFVVGKRLSPRLYLSYSIGLLNPISVVRIRFDITKNIYFQTENSTQANGADIFYSFEK